ncbi:retropepsin-like aspartic protease [Geothrix sp. 21YS21S-4]|uniref:retropepsin-like aspartic protease n=1 Tax=Geothrix sp. 21YS21S-4 TaxID=3068889 RepID=UPI0027BA6F67|nr:retropepsin-like aspartic protease [Geothrix sp. 21YS21S-4]
MDRFYRGERLETAIDRSDAGIQKYNAHAQELQKTLLAERSNLDRMLASVEAIQAQLKAADLELRDPGDRSSREALKRKVDARNALASKLAEQSAKARSALDAHNAMVTRTQQELEEHRKRVMAVQAAVNGRLAAFKAFTESGQDVAFFLDLNRLLADIRQGLRDKPGDPALQERLNRIRGFRRELAAWAIVGQALKTNGLVIVEALVGDEPGWFIVDTGAMDTIVNEEMLDALDLGRSLGRETSLSVIGGLRVKGLSCRIPQLTVAGQTLTEVAASVVPPAEVGVDGLLGQSFLKAFVYTIDEKAPTKLILIRR